ncbi:hypothetical protein [Paenibacillus sp. NPDC058174]|uniref:hypothetical protein n=1 Tax=Paenibacillus sp. NPDC058174 TaxID=3346366 RepID=UPI0036DAEBEE
MYEQQLKEAILNLLFSYSTKEFEKPSVYEVMSVEQALPYIKNDMDEATYRSYTEWINRYKEIES